MIYVATLTANAIPTRFCTKSSPLYVAHALLHLYYEILVHRSSGGHTTGHYTNVIGHYSRAYRARI